jgi:hypothetical protein
MQCNSKIRSTAIDVLSILNKFDLKKISLKIKEKIVSAVESSRSVIGLEKAVEEFSMFKLSKSKFFQWCNEIKYQCSDSIYNLCKRSQPSQLTSKEVSKIKNALNNEFYKGWSVFSIAMHHIKTRKLFVSVSTWYKYVKALGDQQKESKKPQEKK